MEKINVAELLKDCPSGMELDCTMCDKLVLVGVDNSLMFPIKVRCKDGCLFVLTKYGQCCDSDYAKCVIFPKGKTTWEGFHRPFKDGDVIYIRDEYSDATFTYVAIFKQIEKGGHIYSHCFYNYEASEFSTDDYLYDVYRMRFASEEEKQKLFDSIKANGYKWNPDTKTLEKLPKFKVGDIIQDIDAYKVKITEINIDDECYGYESIIAKGIGGVPFNEQDNWELVPNKFDINTLKPFDKVLVRDNNGQQWTADMFSFYSEGCVYPCRCVAHYVNQCIPYDQNKHLLGTTDDCDEYFKTWK